MTVSSILKYRFGSRGWILAFAATCALTAITFDHPGAVAELVKINSRDKVLVKTELSFELF